MRSAEHCEHTPTFEENAMFCRSRCVAMLTWLGGTPTAAARQSVQMNPGC